MTEEAKKALADALIAQEADLRHRRKSWEGMAADVVERLERAGYEIRRKE